MAGTEIRRGGWQFQALIALSIGGVMPILGMPLIVGALADHWSFSAAYAGYITSIDLAGLFVGAVTEAPVDYRRRGGRCVAGHRNVSHVLSAAHKRRGSSRS
jgi:cytosine/uracil/thiamine/allantoin permease